MAHQFTTSYVEDAIGLFRYYKQLAERALEQVSDSDLLREPGPGSNSIATIVKHMAGSMRSRWTDLLTSDGEKPDRNRDAEFEDPPTTRAEILDLWEKGWQCLFSSLEQLTDADLPRRVRIRTEPHSVVQAINRQIGHLAYHVGQIVYLARLYSGNSWQTVSIPRGKSAEFNAAVAAGRASLR